MPVRPLAGPPRTDPRPASTDEVRDAVLSGSWVVDLRRRGFRPTACAGWLTPHDDGVVLLTDTPEPTEETARELDRLGLGGRPGTVREQATGRLRRADWAAYREARSLATAAGTRLPVVVDVRPHEDWLDAHLPGALHLPVHLVETAGRRMPPGELWVHCRSGHRALVAADLLHRTGRDVVHVDDTWERVGELRLETVTAHAA